MAKKKENDIIIKTARYGSLYVMRYGSPRRDPRSISIRFEEKFSKDGKIVKQGHHQDLIKLDGVYKELFETQFRKILDLENGA